MGSPQVINCTVSTVSGVESSSVMISWMRPGGGGSENEFIDGCGEGPIMSSRVTIIPTSTSNGNTYTSSLQFTYLMEGDEGEYTCNAMVLQTSRAESVEIRNILSECLA